MRNPQQKQEGGGGLFPAYCVYEWVSHAINCGGQSVN